MNKTELAEALTEIGILVTVQMPDKQQLPQTVTALAEGGIRAVELSYATIQSAGWLIHTLKETGILVGVGALTRSFQAREASMFGADFITAAVVAPDVVSACEEMDIPCILSGLTPTEIWRAHEMEADFAKIASAEALGGPHYVRSLHEILPAQPLMVGEISIDNCLPYLEAGAKVLELKNSLALPELVEREEWIEISRRALSIVNACSNWRANRKQYS